MSAAPSEAPGIEHCLVVIPARNEAALIGRCLSAVTAARRRLQAQRPDVGCRIVLVLDRCDDDTEAIAATFAGVDWIHSDAGNVGAARHLGCVEALQGVGDAIATSWLACTDADSAVPEDWLLTQLAIGDQGADLVLGMVVPDIDEFTGLPFRDWSHDHPQHDGHGHVYGANLGVRGTTYLAAGGFPSVAEHEDVLLVRAIRRRGARILATAAVPVLTSGRHHGRSPGGFAGWLAARPPDAEVSGAA